MQMNLVNDFDMELNICMICRVQSESPLVALGGPHMDDLELKDCSHVACMACHKHYLYNPELEQHCPLCDAEYDAQEKAEWEAEDAALEAEREAEEAEMDALDALGPVEYECIDCGTVFLGLASGRNSDCPTCVPA